MSCACACYLALLAERRERGGGDRATPSEVRMSEEAVVFEGAC
jgi:hypothetical protein